MDTEINAIPKRQKFNMKKYIKSQLLKYPIMNIKTKHCGHDEGCLFNIIKGSSISFLMAYAAKVLFGLISMLMSKKKSMKSLLNILFCSDSLRFGLFPCLYNLIQKGILCGCRLATGEDRKIMSFISGSLAGALSLSVLEESKRSNWALYLLTRSIDTMFISLQNKNVVPKKSDYYVIFMGLEVLITAYAFGCETDALESYMLKFYTRFANEGKTERDFRDAWHRKIGGSPLKY